MKHLALIIIIIITIASDNFSQIITAQRRVDWKLAGLQQQTPNYQLIADISLFGGIGNGTTPNDQALVNAINSLGTDSGVIFFPPGVYNFNLPITLRTGLVIRGSGSTNTTLEFNLADSNETIVVNGSRSGITHHLTDGAFKGSNQIIVTNGSFYNIGDHVKIFQNDSSLVFDVYNCVGQILNITNVVADTITFNSPLRRNYLISDSPSIRKLNMITGVGIECLKIRRLDSANQKSNILFNYASKCWVKGVESDSANFAHININNSSNIDVSGCYLHGAFAYGPGGQGYGVAINNTTGECLIENNIFSHLRHSILVQSGANGNVITLNYSREPYKSENQPNNLTGDIVLHGNYPYANLFEGNIVQNIVSDLSHYKNGHNNTFFRNRTELYGILYSSGSIDSSNIVGNEIVGINGRYIIAGNEHLEYANNLQGVIVPTGTNSLMDSSYFYMGEPYFWYFARGFPSIGIPNSLNSGTIPAKANFLSGSNLTLCPSHVIFASNSLVLNIIKSNELIQLNWTTTLNNEINYFDIEEGNDNKTFRKIYSQVPITNKNNYIQRIPFFIGKSYYRIKQVLKDGSIVYSNVVTKGSSSVKPKLYPNPTLGDVVVDIIDDVNFSVMDMTGRVLQNGFHLIKNGNSLNINIKNIAKGVYLLQLIDRQSLIETVISFVKQ